MGAGGSSPRHGVENGLLRRSEPRRASVQTSFGDERGTEPWGRAARTCRAHAVGSQCRRLRRAAAFARPGGPEGTLASSPTEWYTKKLIFETLGFSPPTHSSAAPCLCQALFSKWHSCHQTEILLT